MNDPAYLRAVYDEERGSYISTDAHWTDGEPSLEYRFNLLDTDDNVSSRQGGLEKLWTDNEDGWYGEFFAFGEYDSEAAFESDVAQIMRDARKKAAAENIDEFLAVIDLVKQRAVARGYEDEVIEEMEGLFQDGPEDAYTLRDIGDGPRLHDHLDCEEECWCFYVRQVVDTEQQPLGWGLFAIHFPDLPPNAPGDDLMRAKRARVLLLDQHHTKQDAMLAEHGFAHYMETERLDNPEYAYMNDTEVLEGIALGAEWNDDASADLWQEYSGQRLQDFLSETLPYAIPREQWQPPEESLVDRFFKAHPHPVWMEDQFRAALDEDAGVGPDEDEDSPWQNLNLD